MPFLDQQPNGPMFIAGDQPAGMLEWGNIDLTTRPRVRNEDGSISTVRSMSANFDGKEVLFPTVSDDGRIMSDDEAMQTYQRTGKHLGTFDTPEAASAYAQALHEQQDDYYSAIRAVPAGLAPQGAPVLDIETSAPPFRRLFNAAMSRENTIGAIAERVSEPGMSPVDPDYDPFTDIQGYEDFAASFADANSDQDVAVIKRRIDRERQRSELLASSGGMGVLAEVAAGLTDPINLIPIGGEAVTAFRTGGRILEGAYRVGRAGLAASVASEAILQGTQDTRTAMESGVNIAAGTLLSGVLGGAVGAFAGKDINAVARQALAETETFEREYTGNMSAGAAGVRNTTLEQETFTSALGMEKGLAFSSPTLRLGSSQSVEVRRLAQELADQPLATKKNVEGIESPVSVESRMRLAQGPLAQGLVEIDDLFVQYRTGRDRKFGDIARIGVGDVFGSPTAMTREQFLEEVGRAMRRNDQHDIPEVAQAAQAMRRTIFDPLKQRAIELGLLPEDVSVETADSYLTRVYNFNKIIAQRPVFEQRVVDWLSGIQTTVAERVEMLQASRKSMEARKTALEADLPLKRTELEQIEPEAQTNEKEYVRVDRDLKAADRAQRKAFKDQQRAEARANRFRPTKSEDGDPLIAALTDLKRGTTKRPESLTQWLAHSGGLADAGGELKNIGITNKARPGFLRKDGRTLDDAALAAWEQGFFSGHAERPDINDFLNALRDDFNGTNRVYREEDFETLAYLDYLSDLERALDEKGVDLRKVGVEQAKAKLQDTPFRADTPAARAKVREIEMQARKLSADTEKHSAKIGELQPEWDRLKAARETTGAKAKALRAEVAKLERELAGKTSGAERLASKIEQEWAFARSDIDDVKDIARQITDTLLGSSPARTHYLPIPLTRGPLKERTLSIPDAMIEDFLESDIGRVAKIYSRTMSADVELARTFGRADMQDQIDRVRQEYAVLREGVTKEKDLKALDKKMRADIRDLEAVRDRLRGTYDMPENPNGLAFRAQRVVMDLNYLRLLGGMTLSAIPDAGRAVMVHGITRVFGNGLAPMIRDFRKFRLSAEEVKLAGTALDMVTDSRAMSLADVMDDYGRWSKFERGLTGLSNRFGLLSLMAPWNAAWKQFVGIIAQTRSLEAIDALLDGSIAPAERTRLARLGIGPEMGARIQAMYKQFGESGEGVRWANTKDWTDRGAAETYLTALSKEVDETVVTPGQERPLWMTKGIGRMIGQFRSFSVASTQRVMLSGLQRRDMATLNGAALMAGLGMMVYWLKTPEDKISGNPAVWISNGIDRSGLTGWLFDAHNITEKFTRGAIGLSRMTGGTTMSRYASRGVLESLLGPTSGLIVDTAQVAGAGATGDWTEADTRAVRRMLPLQNLIGLRYLFDAAEAGVNDAFGIPTKN